MTKLELVPGEEFFTIWAATGRLAIALGLLPHYRLWNAIHVDNRRASGGGVFVLDAQSYAEWSKLSGFSRERSRVLIAKGRGLWWEPDTLKRGCYYLTGQGRISQVLSEMAAQRGIADPFEKPTRYGLPVNVLSGNLSGAIYEAWADSRKGGQGQQARWQDIMPLWNLSRGQLRRLMGVAS